MKRLADYLFVHHRHNWLLLLRFGLVGGSGVLVNLLVLFVCQKLGPFPENVLVPLGSTSFNIRWYHLYFAVSFLVANLWNFQLNRFWTFKSSKHSGWWTEYFPFLLVGLVTMVIGQVVITLLINDTSPISLSREIFDNSSGFRNRHYWAQLIAVMVTIPISFIVNKVWTFRAVRVVKASFDEADEEDRLEELRQPVAAAQRPAAAAAATAAPEKTSAAVTTTTTATTPAPTPTAISPASSTETERRP